MIPNSIIFCHADDNIDIFKKQDPYIFPGQIHYAANGFLFNPPFYNIVILFETFKANEQDLKLLWNMTKQDGFLILPDDKMDFFKNEKDVKKYKNYTMIHKTNNIVYPPDNKWRTVDFGIFGVQKGGTTAAMVNLAKHPDLYLHKTEIHFFDKYWFKGLEWYKKHFNYSKKLVGEKTPDIIYIDECFPLINAVNPFIKMIFFLRNPINRAYSEFRMLQVKWGIKKTFQECIDEEMKYRIDEPKNLHNSTDHILQRGLYFKQIQNLLKYFPKSNMIFLISEKVRNNMEDEYNKIYKFLNVKELHNQDYTEEFVTSYEKELDKTTYNNLIDYYKEDVKKLEEFLGFKTDWFDI